MNWGRCRVNFFESCLDLLAVVTTAREQQCTQFTKPVMKIILLLCIVVQMLDLSSGEPFTMHSMELPVSVRSLHPLSRSHYLVSTSGDSAGVYLLKKDKVM